MTRGDDDPTRPNAEAANCIVNDMHRRLTDYMHEQLAKPFAD